MIKHYVNNADFLTALLEYKEKYGFKLIVDIDDYWYLDSSHILFSVYPTQEIINHIILSCCYCCDGFVGIHNIPCCI